MTLAYRWALAHERAQNAWASKRAQRTQAWAVARAQAHELGLTGQDRSESLAAWQQIVFDVPADLGGQWEWTVAYGPR